MVRINVEKEKSSKYEDGEYNEHRQAVFPKVFTEYFFEKGGNRHSLCCFFMPKLQQKNERIEDFPRISLADAYLGWSLRLNSL